MKDYLLDIQSNRYWKTSHIYLAGFLLSKELELVNVDKTIDPKRAIFVFKENPIREQLVNSFQYSPENSPDVMVDARKFVSSIKSLKQIIHEKQL